jgi:hypothetical protein
MQSADQVKEQLEEPFALEILTDSSSIYYGLAHDS